MLDVQFRSLFEVSELTTDESALVNRIAHFAAAAGRPEVDPKGWTKFGRRLDGAAG
jgi:hypothetical protein